MLRLGFLAAIRSVIGDQPRPIIIHSSLPKLLASTEFSKWDILYSFGELAAEGFTLCFPSFTFSFCRDGRFDVEKSQSETGVLADWVQQAFPKSKRTEHPIYSFVVLGHQDSVLLQTQSETVFGAGSIFEKFEELDGQVLMLGAGWEYCTQFHRYEELASVPYRFYKEFTGIIGSGPLQSETSISMYVRDLDLECENDFTPIINALERAGEIRSVPFGNGQIEAAEILKVSKIARSLLDENILNFVKTPHKLESQLAAKKRRDQAGVFRVALLGSSNLDIAAKHLQEKLEATILDQCSEVFVPSFGQVSQTILDPNSEYNQKEWQLTIFVDRIEDLVREVSIDLADSGKVISSVENYAELILKCARGTKNAIFVHRFVHDSNLTIWEDQQSFELVSKCNEIMSSKLDYLPNVFWIDIGNEMHKAGGIKDERLWYLGKFPFSAEFIKHIVTHWCKISIAILEKSVRLIVLDLDNTLWGGVIGEDGFEGIQLGGDFPGNAFQDFQLRLLAMAKSGIALAICSKNDEDIAMEVIKNHAEMKIGEEFIVSHRINWKPKWQNIQEVAEELNLGLASILFIDDNPAERELVRLNLPKVKVLELPIDPANYTSTLNSCIWLEKFIVTNEDAKRVSSYKTQLDFSKKQASAASMEDFYSSLEMNIYFSDLNESNLARAAQLCQKTNQFNSTTIRYSADDLLRLQEAGSIVTVIALSDKFSDRENIGLIVLVPDQTYGESLAVNLFLLSCRVLGRTVEKVILQWVSRKAKQLGFKSIIGEIVETERNTPIRSVFADAGYEQTDQDNRWVKNAQEEEFLPWFKVHEQFGDLVDEQ